MDKENLNAPAATVKNGLQGRFSIWVAALALVLAVFFHGSLFCGKGLVSADGAMSFLPWQDVKGPGNIMLSDQYLVFLPQHELMYQQFWQGHFPLWNPYIDCGVPNLGSSQGALLFPINLLLLPVSPFYASGVAAFLKLFLAGWFAMLYARALGVSNSGAFLAGVVFSLSGFMVVWLGHPHVNSAMWLPLFPYLIERFFQCVRERVPVTRVCIAFALAYGCMMLGGHPPTMVHMTMFIGAYFAFRWMRHRGETTAKQVALWAGAILVGVMLAAPNILPFVEYDHNSAENASSQGLQRTSLHLPFNSLIFYLLPRLSGSPVDGWQETLLRLGVGKDLPNFNERTGYVGVLPLLFALYAVTRLRNRFVLFYAALIAICMPFVCGIPPLPKILSVLPVLHAIDPVRLMLLVGFAVAVLSGMGWDQLWRDEGKRSRWWVVGGFWLAVGLVLLGYWLAVASRWHSLEAGCQEYIYPQLWMLLGGLLVSVALLSRPFGGRLGVALGLLWVTADMLVFAHGYNPEISRDRYYPTTPAIDLLKRDAGNSRILGDSTILMPNLSEVFGLRDARGCDFTTVKRYEQLINGKAGDFNFYTVAAGLPTALPLLGVNYYLDYKQHNPVPDDFEMVYSNEITIFRSRVARERALVVYDYKVERDPVSVLGMVRSGTFDPQRELLLEEDPKSEVPVSTLSGASVNFLVHIAKDLTDSVSVNAELPKPGFLLLLDTYFPGWKATVNGEPAKIYQADYNFRAVQLPAGKSTVSFYYEPASFYLGLGMSVCGLLVLGVGLVTTRSGRRPVQTSIQ